MKKRVNEESPRKAGGLLKKNEEALYALDEKINFLCRRTFKFIKQKSPVKWGT
jgi:hypothetical protein